MTGVLQTHITSCHTTARYIQGKKIIRGSQDFNYEFPIQLGKEIISENKKNKKKVWFSTQDGAYIISFPSQFDALYSPNKILKCKNV